MGLLPVSWLKHHSLNHNQPKFVPQSWELGVQGQSAGRAESYPAAREGHGLQVAPHLLKVLSPNPAPSFLFCCCSKIPWQKAT